MRVDESSLDWQIPASHLPALQRPQKSDKQKGRAMVLEGPCVTPPGANLQGFGAGSVKPQTCLQNSPAFNKFVHCFFGQGAQTHLKGSLPRNLEVRGAV